MDQKQGNQSQGAHSEKNQPQHQGGQPSQGNRDTEHTQNREQTKGGSQQHQGGSQQHQGGSGHGSPQHDKNR